MHAFIPAGLSNNVGQNFCITLRSSTTGQPLTGIAYGSVTISITFDDDADSPVSITPVDGTLGSFVSSGWKETSLAGEYQFSIPNTHVATAGKRFKIRCSASGAITALYRVVVYDAAKGLGDPSNLNHQLSDLSARTPDALVSGNLKARVMAMADNVITSSATDSGYITELADAIEAAIANDADMTAVMQTIADRIAADWVAGDASPLAIVAALKADAQWSNLATIQSGISTLLGKVIGTIAAGTHNPQGGDAHAIVSSGTHGNAALLTQIGTLATSAVLALVKAVTDKLDTALQLDGAVYRFTTNALEQAPSGGGGAGTVIINVVPSIVSGGEVLSGPMVGYVDSIATRTIVVEDENSNPIDLSSENLTLRVMTKPLEGSGEEPETVFVLTTGSGITVSGAGDNQVNVTWSRANTAAANLGEHEYSLRSTDGAQAGNVWAHGPYSLRYVPPLPS